MQSISFEGWLTLAAIVAGPVFGAWFALHLQNRQQRKERRFDVFRTLMRTRRAPISPEHVGALNLVEIEFHDAPHVISAWKALLQHFGTPHSRHANEEVTPETPANEAMERNARFGQRIFEERARLLSKLLHAMGASLGLKLEQLDIYEGGYTPEGWLAVEGEQAAARQMFAQIARGDRAFPIEVTFISNPPDQPSQD